MPESKQAGVFLIDASIYIFKYYFSMPDNWWSKDEFPTAAVYGYTHWLFRFLKETRAEYVAACFDESLESCFRNEIYPQYKSSRALPDEALAYQLEACKQITQLLGIRSYASKKYEADDLLGTLAARCRAKGLQTVLLSRDKDLGQLLKGPEECLWDYPDGSKYFPQDILHKFGVLPELLADYLALVGDPGDDIPGVPGVGAKSAAYILTALGGWKNIKPQMNKVAELDLRGAPRLAKKLDEYKEQVDMAMKLATIVCKAPLGQRFVIQRKALSKEKLLAFGQHLGFGARFTSSVEKLIQNLA